MPRIDTYTHTCIVRSGGMAGNMYRVEVTEQDFLDQETCEVCGERLVTLEDLLAHIYSELTKD
jgi:hypothetical protein